MNISKISGTNFLNITSSYGRAFCLSLAFAVFLVPNLLLNAQEDQVTVVSLQQHGFSIEVRQLELSERVSDGEQLFTRVQAIDIGIDHANIMTPDHFIPPYWNGRGIGAGDINKDGYVDLVFASNSGVRLFQNQQGTRYSEIQLNVPGLADKDVFITALVDWDNDSWLDLFFTSYSDGNFWIRNNQGQFADTMEPLIGSPLVLTKALSFGDVDRDGDIDAALGNWFYGYLKHYPPADSDNYLLLNNAADDSQDSQTWPVPGMAGETLSILLSDFSGDGVLDLMVGNDFAPPDYYYIGIGDGTMEMITRDQGVIPISTNTTMSMDTADYDNDLDLDIYATQIAASATGESARIPIAKWDTYCDDISDTEVQANCRESVKQRFLFAFGSKHEPGLIKNCEKIEVERAKQGCISMMLLLTATREKQQPLCDRIPLEHTRFTCNNFFKPSKEATEEQQQEAIPVAKNTNVFLVSNQGKDFENRAADLNLEVTGWSWNSKFADFDNDQWQDIFVVNGTWIRGVGTPSKFYFRNQGGDGFARETQQAGLQNFMLQTAFVEVDVDNDGDLDIIANSTSGPIWFYRNNEQDNRVIQFRFEDEVGNYYGIGNKIIIEYGFLGLSKQIRELKSGGGFLSFSPPMMHFGLKDAESVDRIEIQWSTGEVSELEGPFKAEHRYTINRKATGSG